MPILDIDAIIAAISATHPAIRVRQLQVKYPGADDDGLWFFNHPSSKFEVQLESSSGMLPFIVETDRHNERGKAATIDEAVELVEAWLGISGSG